MPYSNGKTHIVIPDPHAHYKHNNDRALWLGRLIADVRPDVVINLGDTADMPSLSGYDKGKKCFQGRTYKQDIDASNDFEEKLWHEVKKRKKKLPYRVTLHGNHEYRIHRAIEMSPELDGAIGFDDLHLSYWYDEIVPYSGMTPGIIEIDGISYAHYFISGVMGRPIGGLHPAASLLGKRYCSSTAGHSHVLDFSIRTVGDDRKMAGLSAGCFVDYEADWAGTINHLWWSGVIIKTNVANGFYDLQTVSVEKLKAIYG